MRKMTVSINPGDRFGKLQVIRCVGYPSYVKSRINYYLCQCDCGNTKEIRRNHLSAKKTMSCGCVQRTHKLLPPGTTSKNSLYTITKRSAKARDLNFSLTLEEHTSLILALCHYCGSMPRSYSGLRGLKRDEIMISGIDRVDSSIGYVVDNCVSCCTACNRAKWEMSEKDFIEHAFRIVEFQLSLKNKKAM